MELEEDQGEVSFTVKIPNFTSYTEFDETFTTEFPLKVNRVSSLWSLTISPFVKENGYDGGDPINRDIGITLKCLRCNINLPEFEIYSKVQGRDQHEKQLPQRSVEDLTWQGILVSRLGLKVFRLLSDGQLIAHFKFVVKGSDMARAVGGVEGMAKDMRVLMERGTYSDVDILTSDGIRIPVHRSVLHLRSNLLQRISGAEKRILNVVTTPEPHAKYPKTELFQSAAGGRTLTTPEPGSKYPKEEEFPARAETPINSTFGSLSSGYQSCNSRSSSPDPLQRPYNNGRHRSAISGASGSLPPKAPTPSRSSCTPNQVLFKPRRTTPRRSSQTPSAASPNKAMFTLCKDSPSKSSLTPRGTPPLRNSTTPTSSSLKLPPTPKRSTPSSYSLTPARVSPSKRIRTPHSSSPTKRYLTSATLSLSKRSAPSRRSSVCKYQPVPKTPSPNKRLITPMRLSSQKIQLLRRTPIVGTPSPRRRLYQNNDQVSKDGDEDFKPLDFSGTTTANSSATSATGGSPHREVPCGDFKDSPVKPKLVSDFDDLLQKPEIRVNMSASVARALLEWIYTGECNDMDKLARALLVGGLRHGISGLARASEYHLAAALTPSNAPETLFLAQKYSAHILQEAALDYAVKEAAAVTSQPLWVSLADLAPGIVMEFSRRLANHTPAAVKV